MGIPNNFCNVSVDLLCNYKNDLFSGRFVYKLETEEIYTELILFTISQVLKCVEANKVVGKTFKRCKSAGYKKIHHGASEEYAGLSKRQVLMSVTSNEQLRNFNVRFTNKTKPRPVSVKKIQEQHQIDLLGMKRMKVEYKEKCYQYIFLLI